METVNMLTFECSEQKWTDWTNKGPVLRKSDKGCGINCLVFLGVLSEEVGEHLVRNIDIGGTPFADVLNFVNEYTSEKIDYTEKMFNISSEAKIISFMKKMDEALPVDTCILVKLKRVHPDNQKAPDCNGQTNLTPGHTFILRKKDTGLVLLEPQQYKRDGQCCTSLSWEDKRQTILDNWQIINCYTKASVVFGKKIKKSPVSPVEREAILEEFIEDHEVPRRSQKSKR